MNITIRYFIVFFSFIIGFASCNDDPKSDRKRDKKFTPPEPAFVDEGNLYFLNQQDTISTIDIEIADSPDQRQRGLMYRTSMDEKAGMIFVFDKPKPQNFWMKNTYISLDILFIDADFNILHIAPNTVPYAEKSVAWKEPAQYILEVNADYCKSNGIQKGHRIAFQKQ